MITKNCQDPQSEQEARLFATMGPDNGKQLHL